MTGREYGFSTYRAPLWLAVLNWSVVALNAAFVLLNAWALYEWHNPVNIAAGMVCAGMALFVWLGVIR